MGRSCLLGTWAYTTTDRMSRRSWTTNRSCTTVTRDMYWLRVHLALHVLEAVGVRGNFQCEYFWDQSILQSIISEDSFLMDFLIGLRYIYTVMVDRNKGELDVNYYMKKIRKIFILMCSGYIRIFSSSCGSYFVNALRDISIHNELFDNIKFL